LLRVYQGLATVDWALLTASIAWAADSSQAFTTMNTFQQSVKLSAIAIPVWSFSIGFIKLSVACLLLRFQQDRPWRMFLYVLIGLLIIVTIGSGVFAAVESVSLAAADSDPVHQAGAKCVGQSCPKAIRLLTNFLGGFGIATDIVLSLFPLTFLINLRRPAIEKALISVLMAVGLTASAASITKAVYTQKWVNNPDSMLLGFTICTLTATEMLIGSTAACLPCLKSTVQRVLVKCGVDFSFDSSDLPAFFRSLGQMSAPQVDQPKPEEDWEEKGQPLSNKSSARDSERVEVKV